MHANPFGRLHLLYLAFPLHGGTAGTVCLGPNELLRSIFSREMALKAIGPIVIEYTDSKVRGLTDVKLAACILQHIHPEHKIGSAGRTRTYNPDPSGLTAAGLVAIELAPQVGLEPTTLRLTAECSAIELLRNKRPRIVSNHARARRNFYNRWVRERQGSPR